MRKFVPLGPTLALAALVVPPAVAAALSAFRASVSATNAVLVLVLVVVAVAAGGSRVAGVLAALSSAAWFDFFLIRPYLTFTIADHDDVETAVLLCVVGLGVTEIVPRPPFCRVVGLTKTYSPFSDPQPVLPVVRTGQYHGSYWRVDTSTTTIGRHA